jgi:hypothetical protein
MTLEMRDIVDKLTELGIRVDGASCYVREHTVQELCLEYIFISEVHLVERYSESVLDAMPKGWTYYTQTVSSDHWPISTLAYTQKGYWFTYDAMDRQIETMVTGFIEYLDTKDRDGLRAVMLLQDC